jgi:hypothetical protein
LVSAGMAAFAEEWVIVCSFQQLVSKDSYFEGLISLHVVQIYSPFVIVLTGNYCQSFFKYLNN